jgi:hypothetical protein
MVNEFFHLLTRLWWIFCDRIVALAYHWVDYTSNGHASLAVVISGQLQTIPQGVHSRVLYQVHLMGRHGGTGLSSSGWHCQIPERTACSRREGFGQLCVVDGARE